ncbi:MAG: endonuclease domain-containing protein [Bacillota bacterium]
MPYINDKNKLNFARKMRKHPTFQERLLWKEYLRNHKYKFRRQHVIGAFVVDFYCHELKFVIELDGGQHYLDEEMAYDERRTKYLNRLGIEVFRLDNIHINEHIESAIRFIEEAIDERLKTI